MRRQITLSVAIGLFVLAGAAGVGLVTAQESAKPTPIPDTEIGLAKGSVFDLFVPPAPIINTTDPGELPVVGRAFAGAPPRVPHAVADFMPITREENWCIDCHVLDWRSPGSDDPTAIPVSHYQDFRDDTDEIGGQVVGARWVCVSCHAPATDEPSLVPNGFGD